MSSVHRQNTQTIKKQAEFAYVDIRCSLYGNYSCDAYFSDSSMIDLASQLNLVKGAKTTVYTQNRFKILAYFYDKGYELIGTENDCSIESICTHEFYFKLKEK